jgi:hypothetical protein
LRIDSADALARRHRPPRTRTLTTSPTFTTSLAILDEAIGDLGNVNQPVLVHADVHESAERRHVGHRALQAHAGTSDSLMSSTPSAKVAVLKVRARVAARLLQLREDVASP